MSVKRQPLQQLSEQFSKIHKHPINIWKRVQQPYLQGKWKLNLHWDSYLIEVKWLPSEKWNGYKCWGKCEERKVFLLHWLDCYLVQLLCKSIWRFLKIKYWTLILPSYNTPGYILPPNKFLNQHTTQLLALIYIYMHIYACMCGRGSTIRKCSIVELEYFEKKCKS